MTELEDVLTVAEAAELSGLTPGAVKKALQRGTLAGKNTDPGSPRGSWITTRDALSAYLAFRTSRRIMQPRDTEGRIVARRIV